MAISHTNSIKPLAGGPTRRPSPAWSNWRKKLDYWTQGRITGPDDDIRLCMALIIDAMERIKSGFVNVASTSNDGLTVNYASAQTEEQMMGSVYDQIVEILPVELVNLEVGI